LLVVVGLYTRLALVPLTICMAVAVFIIHGDDPFGDKEHALLFLLPYLALMFTGPGKYSLDRLIRKA
ncbi:MAG: DoxX family protein, partial [Cyclobacteriaceae bacterium]